VTGPLTVEASVPAALAGERVDRVVAVMTGLSRSAVRTLIESGAVERNGRPELSPKQRVAEGDLLRLALPERPSHGRPPAGADPAVDLEVVYSDAHLIVVDKPVGLVVHPGPGHPGGTLVNGLVARFPEVAGVGDPGRPGIVHRLDRDTSGLMVVARSEVAHRALVAAMAARLVQRRYDVITMGRPAAPSGVVDAPVGRSRRAPTRMAVTAEGKPARTGYEVVRTFDAPVEAALLSCRLETGRTHQIRVHLAAIGVPVLGDPLYGRPDPLRTPRPMLHAAELAFAHPVSGQDMHFERAAPADFAQTLATFS
jgi:23S rRNA pseudouridine1911/1915/1917 synthase